MSRSWLCVFAALAVTLAACGTSSPDTAASTSSPERAGSASASTQAGQTAARKARLRRHPAKVLVVIEENHSLSEMRSGMPYLARLSRTYGYATHWSALRHPSEPNYLAIAGGSTFGVTDDDAPAANASKVAAARSVFGQALARHKTARTYADSMTGTCELTNDTGTAQEPGGYAVRHNPWTYFPTERAACRRHDTDATRFVSDARHDALPDVGFLIPDLVHDAHDASLARADSWLHAELPAVLASKDFRTGRLVVVVTADEDDKHHGNVVLTSVLSARIHHRVVRRRLDHYSLTRFIDHVIGARPLRNARGAPDMRKAFGL
jgi:acid phosphatase